MSPAQPWRNRVRVWPSYTFSTKLCASPGKSALIFGIAFGVGGRGIVSPGEEAGMADRVHQDRHRGQRPAVVEPEHLDAAVVRAVRD